LSVSNVWDTGTLQPAFGCNQVVIARNYNYYSYIGAGPAVEDLITRRLKKEVEGVEEITSNSRAGLSITIEFNWGTDVDARLVDVLASCSRWRLYRKKRVNLMSKWLVQTQ